VKGKLSAAAVLAGGAAALAAYRARKPKPLGVNYSDAPTKVLIVGGGFGGLAATRELVRAFGGEREVGLGLLDRVNYTTFWPMVPAAISGDIEVGHAASSIRRIIKPFGGGFSTLRERDRLPRLRQEPLAVGHPCTEPDFYLASQDVVVVIASRNRQKQGPGATRSDPGSPPEDPLLACGLCEGGSALVV
jgi:hypothetical protein